MRCFWRSTSELVSKPSKMRCCSVTWASRRPYSHGRDRARRFVRALHGIRRLVLRELDARIEPDVDLRIVERAGLPQLIIDGAAILNRDADFRIGGDHQSDRLLQRHGRRGSCETSDAGQQRSAEQQRRTTKRQSFQLHRFPPNADFLATAPADGQHVNQTLPEPYTKIVSLLLSTRFVSLSHQFSNALTKRYPVPLVWASRDTLGLFSFRSRYRRLQSCPE